MAPVKATTGAKVEKKRVSKAVKRKAKKAPVEESEASVEEEQPVEEAAAAADETTKTKKSRNTKANRLEQMAAKAEDDKEPRGVIYVGHIPEGFFEPQMRKFFGQFGGVTRLRISRSKKNGKSKGYAFVEFEEESVAKIVAETMQGYLLFDKTLVCHMLSKEKQHPMLFKGCKRPLINTQPLRRRKHTEKYNKRPHVEVDGEKLPQLTTRQADKRKKSDKKLSSLLANLGVEYDLAGADDGASRPKSPKLAQAKSPKLQASTPAAGAEPKKKKRKVGA